MVAYIALESSTDDDGGDLPKETASTMVQNKATALYIVRLVLVSPGMNVCPVSGFVIIVRSSARAYSRADRPATSITVRGNAAPATTGVQQR
jgi:hypothetical protein